MRYIVTVTLHYRAGNMTPEQVKSALENAIDFGDEEGRIIGVEVIVEDPEPDDG